MASIWQRGKQKMWVAQFYVSTGKGKGRCVTRSLRTKNKKVAHERKAQLEAELQLGLFEAGSASLKERLKMIDGKLDAIIQPQSSSTPLAKFWGLYQDHLLTKNPYAPAAAVKRKSYSNEVSRIRTFRSWLEPEHPEIMYLEEITPEVISSFLMHRKTGAGNSNSTVNHYRQILCTLFEFARAQAGYTCPLSRIVDSGSNHGADHSCQIVWLNGRPRFPAVPDRLRFYRCLGLVDNPHSSAWSFHQPIGRSNRVHRGPLPLGLGRLGATDPAGRPGRCSGEGRAWRCSLDAGPRGPVNGLHVRNETVDVLS